MGALHIAPIPGERQRVGISYSWPAMQSTVIYKSLISLMYLQLVRFLRCMQAAWQLTARLPGKHPMNTFQRNSTFSIRNCMLTAALAVLCSSAPLAQADVVAWTISGPGTTSVVANGAMTALTYAQSGPAVHSTQTWTATAIAGSDRDYTFAWRYAGFHAFYQVTAFLDAASPTGTASLVNAGPTDCCVSPSNGFDYTGTYTFSDLHAGDVMQFSFGGANFDSNMTLRGVLQLAQIPEPASIALIGFGLAGLAAVRRRRIKQA